MALGAVSLNMFWNPAIKGSSFLQASMKGIHTYATKLDKVNILGKTKFPMLNKHLESTNNWLGKIQSRTAKISRQPLDMMNAKGTRDVLKQNLALSKKAYDYQKGTSYQVGKQNGLSMGGRAKRASKKVSGSSVVGAGMAMLPMVLPIRSAIGFETSMLRVKALSGATGKDFKMLEKTALNLGQTTEWKAGQVAVGMQYLTMAGFKPQETVQAMPGLLSLATAGELDLKSTSDIASNIMGSFKIKADKMGMVSDIMAKTITTANVDIRMLGDSMKYSAPIAKKAGLTLAETAAMTGLLGNIGIQGSMAGTATKSIITRLASPPTEAKKVLKNLKISTKDKDGNLRSIPLLLQEVYNKTKDKGTGLQLGIMKKIFGLEPLAGGAELIDLAGKGELQKYIGIVNNYEGTANQIAKTQLSGTAGRMKLFGSAVEGLSISFSKNLLPPLTKFITKITSGLNVLTKWSDEHPKLSSYIYGTGIALGTGVLALTAFGFVSTMVGAGVTALAGGFGLVATGIKAFSLAMVSTPIGILATIAGAGYLIYQNWDWLKENAGAIWTKITEKIKAPFTAMFEWINNKFKTIMGMVDKVKNFSLFGDAKTVTERQEEKGIGKSLQIKPTNNTNYNPTQKVGMKLNKGFSLAEQLNVPTLDVQSPSKLAEAHIAKKQAENVTNNNMQQTHQTVHNNVTINNTGGTIDQHEFNRAFEEKQRNDEMQTQNTTMMDAS